MVKIWLYPKNQDLHVNKVTQAQKLTALRGELGRVEAGHGIALKQVTMLQQRKDTTWQACEKADEKRDQAYEQIAKYELRLQEITTNSQSMCRIFKPDDDVKVKKAESMLNAAQQTYAKVDTEYERAASEFETAEPAALSDSSLEDARSCVAQSKALQAEISEYKEASPSSRGPSAASSALTQALDSGGYGAVGPKNAAKHEADAQHEVQV